MNLQKLLQYLPTAGGFTIRTTGLVKEHLTGIENQRQLDNLRKSIDENIELNKTLRKSLESMNPDREMKLDNLNSIKESHETIQNNLEQITETNINNSENISKAQEVLSQLNDNYNTIIDLIKKSGGNDGNNFIDTNILESINNYINSLTTLETLAVLHICGSLIILFSMFSILSIFYGEFFIQKFSLETRYPKLAKFIKLRRKYQQFYLFTQFLSIFAILIVSTFVDLLFVPSLFN